MIRPSIYFHAILPFIATVFLTIGFYAEKVLGFIVPSQSPGQFNNFWTLTAGIGFLIHAMLGWSYGPVRDDRKKEHPCLIPYKGLSNSEKQYDMAMETLKLIYIWISNY